MDKKEKSLLQEQPLWLDTFIIEKRQNKLNDIVGEKKNIEWGSQIRSYVFCPYTLVKDNRTDFETADVYGVMNGNIEGFLYAYLQAEAKKNAK